MSCELSAAIAQAVPLQVAFLVGMNRYKGQTKPKYIERDFPHIVEIAVPELGFGRCLDTMHDWHTSRDVQSRRGRGRRENCRHYIRWCFADPQTAADFMAEFGGTKVG